LSFDDNGKLSITTTPNAVNPIENGAGTPILACDVWEHSYYVNYRNARPMYVKEFIENMVNWESVADAMT
jgi:Fe-Mn family superoxide dismutase